MRLEATKTVGEIAVEMPRSIPYFEERGIDYCCGGKKSLQEACAKAGLAVGEAVQALEGIAQKEDGNQAEQWPSLGSLIQYILDKHHAYTREQLALVGKLGSKVLMVHGNGHPELASINRLLEEITEELLHHLMKEEQVAFPFLQALERGGTGMPFPYAAFQNGPQQVLMGDHDATGEQLRDLRRLTKDYSAPGDACVTFRAFYQGLRDLEADIHQHIHLENNVLFPMAERLAGGL